MVAKLVLGMSLLVVLAVMAVAGAILGNRVPLREAPGLAVRLATYLGSNVVQTSDSSAFPERRSLPLQVPAAEFAARARPLILALGWSPHAGGNPLHYVVTTAVLRFKDDVRLSLRTDLQGKSWLEVRAGSRVGRGDLGANTRHLMMLRDALVAGGLVREPSPAPSS